MIGSLADLHFLRPWGLVIALAGVLLLPLRQVINRRKDALSRMIAPHLLPHLALNTVSQARFRPIHGFSLLLVLAGLSIAGPSWNRVLPALSDDQTRVTVVLDLSESMADNNTLALAQDRIQTLAENQPGWHIGLIVYAQSAHRVLPGTRDRQLLMLYLNSLEAGMIPGEGRNLSAALDIAIDAVADDTLPETVILMTDTPASAPSVTKSSPNQGNLKVLALLPTDALSIGGLTLVLERLSAEVRTFSTTQEDTRWLASEVESHFSRHQRVDEALKWHDVGYWLVWPALLLSLVFIRKGWQLQWCLVPLALLTAPVPPASAGELANAFLTSDQQGRLAFESGDYAEATRLFQDPYLRGLSAYRAADFQTAVESFRRLDSAPAWFYLGNIYARQLELTKARVAFETALERDPELEAAKSNLALLEKLAEDLDEGRTKAPDLGADDVRFDKDPVQGKRIEIPAHEIVTDALWLENLSTSATDFLKRRFAAEQRNALGEQP